MAIEAFEPCLQGRTSSSEVGPGVVVTAVINGDPFTLEGIGTAEYWNLRKNARSVEVYVEGRKLLEAEALLLFGHPVFHRERPHRGIRARSLRRRAPSAGATYLRAKLREASFWLSIQPPTP